MSGRRRGVVAASIRGALWLASYPYRAAVRYRNWQFDSGRRSIEHCGVPVISVGNLTTGGTGKTPIVAFLARWLRERGLRVAIVSRGYGRGDADENDEAAELHWRLPDVPHVQDADRVLAANIAVEELESEIILMDDGFQHRRLHRDLDFVLVDATCPFGYEHPLPRGLLREPLQNLKRADAVILTRSDQVSPQQLAETRSTIQRIHPQVPVAISVHHPSGLLEYPAGTRELSELSGKRVALVCGIGNPDAFAMTVSQAGGEVIDRFTLPDHAAFDRETILSVEKWCQQLSRPDWIICTQKDLVKLQTDRLAGLPLFALAIEAKFNDFSPLEMLLASTIQAL